MDTLLNVGLSENTLPGLLRVTGNPRLAWDSYRRLVQAFAEVVQGSGPAAFETAVRDELVEQGVERLDGLDFRGLRALTTRFLDVYAEAVGEPFPQDPWDQLEAAVAAVLRSWNSARAVAYRRANDIAEDLGTAVTVQRWSSAIPEADPERALGSPATLPPARIACTWTSPSTPRARTSCRAVRRCDTGRISSRACRDVHRELLASKTRLEVEFRDAQEFEFTVQDGRLFVLQTRAAKRTPLAALRIAVEQLDAGLLNPDDARKNLAGIDLSSIEIVSVLDVAGGARWLVALPRASARSAGRSSSNPARAVELASAGRPVVLVREDIATSDIAAIHAATGILTARGGRTSHAAVVARQLGKACIVGCEGLKIEPGGLTCSIAGRVLREGDILGLDASTGAVYAGELRVARTRPTELLMRLGAHLQVSLVSSEL